MTLLTDWIEGGYLAARSCRSIQARLLAWSLAVLAILLATSHHALAQSSDTPESPTALESATSPAIELKLTVGLDGHWKSGHLTRIQIEVPATESRQVQVVAVGLDGDGVKAEYLAAQSLQLSATETVRCEILLRTARIGAGVAVELRDQETTLAKQEITPEIAGTVIPPMQPWVVMLGSKLQLQQNRVRNVREGLPAYSTSTLSKADQLPTRFEGYSGVDLLAISTSELELLKAIDHSQQQAIVQYVQSGGRVLISIGSQADEVKKLPWLAALLPGEILGSVASVNAGPVEAMVGAKRQLGPLTIASLELKSGRTDLFLALPSREQAPWIVRHIYGLGHVTTLAADLDVEPLQTWQDRDLLVKKLLDGQWVSSDPSMDEGSRSSSSYLGYNDLVGQLRGSLDLFPQVQWLPFSMMAFLLVVLLVLIGPLEYWLLVKVGKRPGITWLAVTISACIFSIMLWRSYQQSRPTNVLVNKVELIDVDTAEGIQRGRSWYHLYHSAPSKLTLTAQTVSADSMSVNTSISDWQALPGKAIGALESDIRVLQGLPNYCVNVPKSTSAELMTESVPSIQSLPFTAGGTKSLRTEWTTQLPRIEMSSLREQPGTSMVEGTIRNPLSEDLLDGILVYRNWVYTFPSRIRAGETINLKMDVTPPDLARHLTRRRAVDGKDQSTPWDAADRQAIPRLMEMFMLYRAAGGEKYTGLHNRFEPHLDMSEMLTLGRAVWIVRLPQEKTHLQVERDGAQVEPELNSSTFVRFVLPVERPVGL